VRFEGKFKNEKGEVVDWWFEAPSENALRTYLNGRGWEAIFLKTSSDKLSSGRGIDGWTVLSFGVISGFFLFLFVKFVGRFLIGITFFMFVGDASHPEHLAARKVLLILHRFVLFLTEPIERLFNPRAPISGYGGILIECGDLLYYIAISTLLLLFFSGKRSTNPNIGNEVK